jgi:catechol 2,3-dioxygenase-like lactoylglutathione lyase family enzyme
MSDLGFTHIALSVSNVDKSISFHAKYADLKVVHRRVDQITSLDVA